MDNQKLSEDFLNKLTSLFAGYLPPAVLDSFILLLEKEIKNHFFTFSAESNLLRIISSMYDKHVFIAESVKYPHYIEIIVNISVNSNYLTDILVRSPEYFYRIVNPSHLNKPFTPENSSSIINETVNNYKSFNGRVNALRTIKRREILRIGLKDILGISNLEQTTSELSLLAAGLSGKLFQLCYDEILERNKIGKVNNSYCIISLGKLGGSELNYSSDIDLMIFYDKESSYQKKSYREILTAAIFLFIEQASSVAGSEYLYRIDFRLRPDGRNAPLCSSINEYMNYYESRGEDWERQMLIKADFLGGDPKLFSRFISYLQPFIYPSSFRNSPVEQIQKLKMNIENVLSDEQNIKLAGGGIRDIEFTIQALQLLNGYRYKDIKTGNSIEALKGLVSAELISSSEFNILYDSYKLYRRIEHFLQLMNDLQTHTIPAGGEMLSRLSSFLGYKTETELLNELSEKRKKVRDIFMSLTGSDKTDFNLTASVEVKFRNQTKAAKDLNYLREGKGLLGNREFDRHSINAFAVIEPDLLKHLSESLNPDLVLQNFVRIIKTSPIASVWYNLFRDKKIFNSFLTVCEYAQRAVDLFAEDIHLQEIFISGHVFKKQENLSSLSTREVCFILSVQLCLKIIDPEKFSSLLSNYFSERITEISAEFQKNETYIIAGMGSLGTSEMSFASDIDLIFIIKKISTSKDQQKVFQNLLKRLKEEFKPFETDCRLRPEGKSSQLVWDIESYKNYLNTRARVWELQAFTKIRFITGDRKLYNSLTRYLKERISREECSFIRREVSDMRRKLYPADVSGMAGIFNIKKSSGGLTDIEFLLQYLILCNSDLYPKSRGNKLTRVLPLLIPLISEKECDILSGSYKFLKSSDLANQNIFNVNNHIFTKDDDKLKAISTYMGFKSSDEFISVFNNTSRQIHFIYKKFLGSK